MIKSEGKTLPPFSTALYITLGFVAVAGLCTYCHELWRDEYEKWLIAVTSHSFSQLVYNSRYEGHPILWFWFIYLGTKISQAPEFMQVIHVPIAIASAWIIARYSPFRVWEKVLLVFGYFFVYEYCVIANNYAPAILCIMIIAVLLRQWQRYYWAIALLIFLMCNTHLYGAIFGGIVIGYIMLLIWEEGKYTKAELFKLGTMMAIGIVGVGLLYLQIKPALNAAGNHKGYVLQDPVSLYELCRALAKGFDTYFPISSITTSGSFGVPLVSFFPVYKPVIFVWMIWLAAKYMRDDKPVFLFYLLGTILLQTMIFINTTAFWRHTGFLYILLIVAIWQYRERGKVAAENKKPDAFGRWVFTMLLVIHAVGGAIAVIKDVVLPFSNIKQAGQYAAKQGYNNVPMIGMVDYVTVPLTAYTHQPQYLMQSKREQMYMIWDDVRQRDVPPYELAFDRADSLAGAGIPLSVVVLSMPRLDALGKIITTGVAGIHSDYKLVHQISTDCIIGDELYYFYEVRKK